MNKKNEKPTAVSGEAKRKNKPLIIFISAFLSAVLILGIVLISVMGVRSSRAVVEYDGLTMDMETVSYFASYYKCRYMSILSRSGVENVLDQPAFWNTVAKDSDKTYGELLAEGVELYIRQVMAAAYLFDNYATLGAEDRDAIKESAKDVLNYSEAEGDKKLFNKHVSIYGFDYSSFKKAAEFLYKASLVKNIIYGQNGANLKNFPDLCEEYLSEYTHVKLLYIRTETKYVYDQNGNREVDENGFYVTAPLNEDEKAERLSIIEKIRSYINATANGGESEMTSELFETYIKKYDELDSKLYQDGYYFHENSSFTANFPKGHREVIEKAYSMEIESYDELKHDTGVYFIYKYAPTSGIYTTSISEVCFTDFYTDLASKLFDESLNEIGKEVVFKSAYGELDLILLPYNDKFYLR